MITKSIQDLQVVRYDDRYQKDFFFLNKQWIEKYFRLEEMDKKHLQNPKENIIDKGGEIFFVLENEKVLGTCALVPKTEDVYELAKMAVNEEAHGRGIGNILMKTVIEFAKNKKLQKLMLVSNTKLEPAIHLYKKYGFKTVKLNYVGEYERENIHMELDLDRS